MSKGSDHIRQYARILKIDGVDRDAIGRFINDTKNQRDPDPADVQNAGLLLMGLVEAVKAGENAGVLLKSELGIRKLTKKRFDPKMVTVGSQAWEIVADYVRGEISHGDAVEKLVKQCYISKSNAERAIRQMKPGVENAVNCLNWLSEITFKK